MLNRPADSGDPNRARDKSKDIPVYVDGNDSPMAIVYADLSPPQVLWQVYGPQDADKALQIAEGVIAALKGQSPRVANSAQSVEDGEAGAKPVAAPALKKSRPMSAAFREHIAAGLSDDEIWEKIVAEFNCGKEHRSRIKEYRREADPKPPVAPDPYLQGITEKPASGKYLLDSATPGEA